MRELYKNIILTIVIVCTIPTICHSTFYGDVFWVNEKTNKEILVNLLNETAKNDADFFDDCFNLFIDPATIIDTKKYSCQSLELKKRKWALCRVMDSENKIKATKALKLMDIYSPSFFSHNKDRYKSLDDDLNRVILNILGKFNCSAASIMQEEIFLRKKLMDSLKFNISELSELIEIAELIKEFKNLHEAFLKEINN